MFPGLPDVAELQLMFAQFNFLYFDGEIPAHTIAYNRRFGNLAGRITYKPPTIELSPKHLAGKPDELRETLLHEMIHAWLHAKGLPPGHTPTFKKKMRELGLRSIYHDLGKAAPLNESTKRYILRCETCAMEVLRKKKPSAHLICARCRKPLAAFLVTGIEPVELGRAASRSPRTGFRTRGNPYETRPTAR